MIEFLTQFLSKERVLKIGAGLIRLGLERALEDKTKRAEVIEIAERMISDVSALLVAVKSAK